VTSGTVVAVRERLWTVAGWVRILSCVVRSTGPEKQIKHHTEIRGLYGMIYQRRHYLLPCLHSRISQSH